MSLLAQRKVCPNLLTEVQLKGLNLLLCFTSGEHHVLCLGQIKNQPMVFSIPLEIVSIDSYRSLTITEKIGQNLENTSWEKEFMLEFPNEEVMLDCIKRTAEIKEDSICGVIESEITLKSFDKIYDAISSASPWEISKMHFREQLALNQVGH